MKFTTLTLTLLFAIQYACAQKTSYEVIRFNNPSITIEGKKIKQGMLFKDDATIKWPTSEKAVIIECKNKNNGMLYRFSDCQFSSHNARTISEFYLRVNKASTREVGADVVPFDTSPNASDYGEKRIALVIGNSEYKTQPYLRNAASDAAEIHKKLLKLGFDVIYGYDCTYSRMRTLLNNFTTKAENYDAAVIYYSGHGVQNKDQNYMVPIECPLEFESNLNQCVGAYDFVEKLEETGCETKIVFFDACRNVHTSWRRSGLSGLASMEGTPGMVIVFSTQKGQTAADGEGDKSPFAEALLDNIENDISFSDMMNNVVKQTYTNTGKVQYPVTMGNLISGFNFNTKVDKTAKSETAKQLYNNGRRLYSQKDYKQAIDYFLKAGDKGSIEALNALGVCFMHGHGVDKDIDFAIKLFQTASKEGNSVSSYLLGFLYFTGTDIAQDYNLAFYWYSKAADQGNIACLNNLGVCYRYGYGVAKDMTKAFEYFQEAAKFIDRKAQTNLGECYQYGYGVDKDYGQALYWYLKAAEGEYDGAFYNLGVCYENGYGVDVDKVKATDYYKQAAKKGNEGAKKKLLELVEDAKE